MEHYSCHPIVESFLEQMNLKNKTPFLLVGTYRKRKEVPYMDMSRDNDQKGREFLCIELSGDID